MSETDIHRTDAAPPQPGLRFLEAAVYIMGGLLVLMLVGLIGGIVWKVATRGDTPPEPPKLVDLDLSAAAVTGMDIDGDRLAIRSASEIVVVDTKRGTVLARIKLKP